MSDAPDATNAPLLIAYDGSEDARAAVTLCAQLMPGARCTVLSVWRPFVDVMARASAGFSYIGDIEQTQAIDEATEQAAQRIADEGADLARQAGMEATGKTSLHPGSTPEAILDEADRMDASAIVLGSRGLGRVASLVLGSVSHGVLQRSERPVLVVPSSKGDED